jgi:hypothetical protein
MLGPGIHNVFAGVVAMQLMRVGEGVVRSREEDCGGCRRNVRGFVTRIAVGVSSAGHGESFGMRLEVFWVRGWSVSG